MMEKCLIYVKVLCWKKVPYQPEGAMLEKGLIYLKVIRWRSAHITERLNSGLDRGVGASPPHICFIYWGGCLARASGSRLGFRRPAMRAQKVLYWRSVYST
jgi:hypothetical protein